MFWKLKRTDTYSRITSECEEIPVLLYFSFADSHFASFSLITRVAVVVVVTGTATLLVVIAATVTWLADPLSAGEWPSLRAKLN